jgi:hypothetical protein
MYYKNLLLALLLSFSVKSSIGQVKALPNDFVLDYKYNGGMYHKIVKLHIKGNVGSYHYDEKGDTINKIIGKEMAPEILKLYNALNTSEISLIESIQSDVKATEIIYDKSSTNIHYVANEKELFLNDDMLLNENDKKRYDLANNAISDFINYLNGKHK